MSSSCRGPTPDDFSASGPLSFRRGTGGVGVLGGTGGIGGTGGTGGIGAAGGSPPTAKKR
jgi:hypothetical protein